MSKDSPETTPDEWIKTLIDKGFATVKDGIITISFSKDVLEANPALMSFMQLLMDKMKKGEKESLAELPKDGGYFEIAPDEGYNSPSPNKDVADPEGQKLLEHLRSKGNGR